MRRRRRVRFRADWSEDEGPLKVIIEGPDDFDLGGDDFDKYRQWIDDVWYVLVRLTTPPPPDTPAPTGAPR